MLAPFVWGRVARGSREDPRVVAPLAVGRGVLAMKLSKRGGGYRLHAERNMMGLGTFATERSCTIYRIEILSTTFSQILFFL